MSTLIIQQPRYNLKSERYQWVIWMLLILIGLACLGWYFASAPSWTPVDEKTLAATPDATISQLTVRQFAMTGQLSHYLHTPRLNHVALNDAHYIHQPHVIIIQTNQPAWEIHAQQAIALHGGQKITFKQHVYIHQKKNATTSEKTLQTEQLTYYPHKKLASTRHEITFKQPGNIIQSIGMQAYLDENRVKLLSNARGSYAATPG